ncbi:hypothetical protein Mgrana_01973 [Meiothermus granaticius NBRC 107808]|uniref:Uncharacterized protein n=2 Tax=Meiothermus TaxID=65551 RepID=A0A399F8U8_9DEIN|nr:hypothetical protein Mgrana_01973 [Meiothermus granaticius NBRC 107808]
MVILAVLMVLTLGPIAASFRLTGQNNRTLNATTQAQQIMEGIRGSWQNLNCYQRTQAAIGTLPGNVSVGVSSYNPITNTTTAIGNLSTVAVGASCTTGTITNATYKRVVVSVRQNANMASPVLAQLTLDIPSP